MNRSAAGPNTLPGDSPLSASGHFGVGVNERALVTGRNATPGVWEGLATIMLVPATGGES